MSEHWSEYWKSGHLTSFGNEFSDNYTGQLRSIWESIFNRLPNNFKLLDVATGNGALPLLAQDYLKKFNFIGTIKGIDFASINPQPLIEYHQNKKINIDLLGNVRAESLPFSDNEFDAVISQFGIEYSDIKKSFYEVNRVLVNGGIFESIIHHKNSSIIKNNTRLLNFLGLAQIESVIMVLRQLAQDMGNMRGPDDLKRVKSCPKCENSRLEVNRLLAEIATFDEIAFRDTELLTYVNNFFKSGLFWSVDKKLEYLDFVESQLLVYKNRLNELVAAAMDSDNINNLKLYLTTFHVADLVVDEVHSDKNEIIAWHMRYTKLRNIDS
ncbi:class I SAM-dependent methyltransferase [Shewanella sp.]|uniref:class I SAM-dependent methyltransferase n=1 Tax=Shewanella sp. TaxID=50422 RepID=UPI003A8629C3